MWQLLTKHIRLILLWGVIIAVLSGGISLLFPREYSAESQVLIISRNQNGVDPYTQAKAAETIGANLAQVMSTTDFYDKVMEQQNTTFDKSRWQNITNERDRRKQWQKDVQAAMVYNSSILSVTAYAPTKDDAQALDSAVTDTLTSRGWEYVGGSVDIKEVSSPLVSRFQARPNIFVNTGVGFLVGALLAALWAVRYKRHVVFGNV